MQTLRKLLSQCSSDELRGLAKILEAPDSNIKTLVDVLLQDSQHLITYIMGNEPSYRDVVRLVADKLKITYPKYLSARDIEILIAKKVLETVWEKMTPEQRQEMELELRKVAQQFDKGGELLLSGSMFSALTAAQLSGFGIYLLASTSLGAITTALGIALPFVVYTTMSSTIAIIIGPVGWIGMGLLTLWHLTGPNHKHLLSAVLYICMLRTKYYPSEDDINL
jgi:uncharacterized protein YaaW (UPF0174 family)